ncbi:hypothetical protein V6N13_009252 [Hibiscus sabdariffa]|uniref:Uncharacterized protein n=2 Tax=Hibiscus sabdariffa TaxID=183260 RepID=A0ABR2DJB6_9ROSI
MEFKDSGGRNPTKKERKKGRTRGLATLARWRSPQKHSEPQRRRRLQEPWTRVLLESPMTLLFHEEGRGQNELGILDPFTTPNSGGSVNREGLVRSTSGRSAEVMHGPGIHQALNQGLVGQY